MAPITKKEAILSYFNFEIPENLVNKVLTDRDVKETENYIYAEFTTAIMRYVDDVEFYFPDEKVIHIRSASRIGYSDMGLNRKRIEKIRQLFKGNS